MKIFKSRFPIAALMLSASPFVLALENNAVAAQDTTAPAAAQTPASPPPPPPESVKDEDIQKVVVVSTGSRGAQRTMVDTPVPIDILSTKELNKTGQVSLDKSLQFRVPSFNTVQTPVNDATSLLDPYEIRNMGPSRVLILINGKRKNFSSLIYTQTSPGRGESGADIAGITADAIKRIEVLRDGASAQYGSDAIAGVVNIILKDNPSGGALTFRTGVTGEGDGKMGALSVNNGIALGDRGFVNFTVDYSKVGLASRSGIVNARGEAGDFGADLNTQVLPFLKLKPDAGNINGSPETEALKGVFNTRYEVGDGVAFYANGAYMQKKVNSFANYRTPYWRPTDYGLLTPAGQPYIGYVPTFEGTLDDFNATGGFKFMLGDWNADVSLTYGGNEQKYLVRNSVNRGMENAVLAGTSETRSPTVFKAGGVDFGHWVLNGDLTRKVSDTVSVGLGTELRHENYEVIAGEPASYILGGADSYAGNSPENSFPSSRSNYGVYGGATWDISPEFLIDATGRFEKYTDFGNAFVWKLATRWKPSDTLTVRASASTGFRAPSLAQIYTQKAQYSFVPGSGIQVSGLVNNVSPQAIALGVPSLKAEKSDNFTVGLGWKPDADTSVTVDYYNITVKDRIILGKEIVPSGNPAANLDQILAANGIVSVSFFVNGLDSKTSGIDYVLSRKNLNLLDGKLTLNLSGNYTLDNKREGAVKNPSSVASAGQSVLDATQEALMFTSRPKFKTIFGADLDYAGLNFSLNNTVFGPTRFRNAGMDQNLEVEFKTKTVTDFAVNYELAKNLTFTFNLNNVFDVTPEWKFKPVNNVAAGQALLNSTTLDSTYGLTPAQIQHNLITFNGRYSMVTYDGSHFSQLGRTFAASLQWRF
jgi:iron complex outermembrane receptor protein